MPRQAKLVTTSLTLWLFVGVSAEATIWKDIWDISKDIYEMFWQREQEKEERRSQGLPQPSYLRIDWRIKGGHFKILGPNPEGEWASQPFERPEYWWLQIVMLIHNTCNDAFYIDPERFQLAVSNDLQDKSVYEPTQRGLQYQKNRLSDDWIRPGEDKEGYLVFAVRYQQGGYTLEEARRYYLRQYQLLYNDDGGACPIYLSAR